MPASRGDRRSSSTIDVVSFAASSKSRLTDYDVGRFPTASLFDRLGRAVCAAGCLPRKELYEAWEMARRVRRRFRGGRVVDVAGGHGLLAHVMLLLDDSSPEAVVIDPVVPPSARVVSEQIVAAWPRLAGRVRWQETSLEAVELHPHDIVVSSHACGSLSDLVLERAANAGARVAVLPCCHDVDTCDAGALTGWVDPTLAIDLQRVWTLEQRGYRVWTLTIPRHDHAEESVAARRSAGVAPSSHRSWCPGSLFLVRPTCPGRVVPFLVLRSRVLSFHSAVQRSTFRRTVLSSSFLVLRSS